MKKQVFIVLLLSLFATATFAQQRGQGGRADRAERQKQQIEKLKKDLDLNKNQIKQFDAVTKKFDEKRTKMMEDMRAGGGDFQGMREKMEKVNKERTDAIKKFLTKAQVKKYNKILKEQAEQRSQRGQGRGNGSGRGIRR